MVIATVIVIVMATVMVMMLSMTMLVFYGHDFIFIGLLSAHTPLTLRSLAAPPRRGWGNAEGQARHRLVGASYTKTRLVYGIRGEAGCNMSTVHLSTSENARAMVVL